MTNALIRTLLTTRRTLLTTAAGMLASVQLFATDYYLSPTGNDVNNGLSRTTAFATMGRVQRELQAGDNVYILPGTYAVTEAEISREENPYKILFNLNHQGQAGKPIRFIGITEDGQRPVFDLSAVNPTGFRVTAFYVTGCYMVFRNFDVIGINVNITDHTQSENFRIRNGHHNTFDNVACHDGMGIGFYLTNNSHHNLFVNCDGYNNYDPVSENGKGGQNDGFGCHVQAGNPGNIFIGCRAWNNSDDGYDLINCFSPVTFCYSIAWHNGYDKDGNKRQDGNGFKAGGYGMGGAVSITEVPMHEVYHNLAIQNKSNGIYSNHHLGGIHFSYNTSSGNGGYNYSLVNRRGAGYPDEAVDVNGYGHKIDHNLSFTGKHVVWLDGADGQNTITDNSFSWNEGEWVNASLSNSDFQSTNITRLTRARLSNGMLDPTTSLTYLQQVSYKGYGCNFSDYEAAVSEARELSGAGKEDSSSSGINLVVSTGAWDSDGPIYSLSGQRVGKNHRGVLLKNGRKYLNK